jgi:hypothetical protein
VTPHVFNGIVKKYLEIHSECDLLILQIHAFLDNYFDVGQLLEDSETKQQAIGKVSELEEQLAIVRHDDRSMNARVRVDVSRRTNAYKNLKTAI